MNTGYYVLRGRTPVLVKSILEWAREFENTNRQVAWDQLDDASISTVFLGLDHNFLGSNEPLLFETLVFGGKLDGEMERCSTYEQAEEQHRRMVEKVKSA